MNIISNMVDDDAKIFFAISHPLIPLLSSLTTDCLKKILQTIHVINAITIPVIANDNEANVSVSIVYTSLSDFLSLALMFSVVSCFASLTDSTMPVTRLATPLNSVGRRIFVDLPSAIFGKVLVMYS